MGASAYKSPFSGSGESGKSTIVKQMKIIHQNGYSKEELLNFRMIVHKNLVDSAQALVMACRKLGVDPEDPANRVSESSRRIDTRRREPGVSDSAFQEKKIEHLVDEFYVAGIRRSDSGIPDGYRPLSSVLPRNARRHRIIVARPNNPSSHGPFIGILYDGFSHLFLL